MVDREPVPEGAPGLEHPDGLDVFGTSDDTSPEGHRSTDDEPVLSPRLGRITLVTAVALLAADGLALGLLAGDAVQAAATFALVTLLGSIVNGVLALVAVAMQRGRRSAVAAVLLSVLANPFVLVFVIGRFVGSV